jgi:hypothetical protein
MLQHGCQLKTFKKSDGYKYDKSAVIAAKFTLDAVTPCF